MAKPLVIVESPAKAKTIAGYLGSDYTVMASVGHIRDLPRHKDEVPDDKKETHGRLAGIDPDDHFDACYVVPANKKKVVAELKAALKGADELILATDEDREGEAIGWHVLEVLAAEGARCGAWCSTRSRRTRSAKRSPIPRELDMKLVEAQEGRRMLDRLVGWETSPVLWRVFGRGQAASAGRVQSVAVRMVVERERARMRVPLRPVERPRRRRSSREDQPFRAVARRARRASASPKAATSIPRPARSPRRAPTTSCCSTPSRGRGSRRPAARRRVPRHVRSRPIRSPSGPRAPFTTSTLQQESGRKLRYTAARTMAVAQRLYERGLHHLHAYRQHEPVGAGDHRGPHRDPRAVRRGVPARPSRARTAAR